MNWKHHTHPPLSSSSSVPCDTDEDRQTDEDRRVLKTPSGRVQVTSEIILIDQSGYRLYNAVYILSPVTGADYYTLSNQKLFNTLFKKEQSVTSGNPLILWCTNRNIKRRRVSSSLRHNCWSNCTPEDSSSEPIGREKEGVSLSLADFPFMTFIVQVTSDGWC